MKRGLFIVFLLIGKAALSQTQLEMNQQAHAAYQQADKELNTVYRKILSLYKADTVFIANLKESQRIWIKFRDAEVKMKYPDREAGFYGSVQPLCWSNYLKQLTHQRTERLREWLKGAEEGDVYAGSALMKE
jgi:uncharacterized protein YecT (DUF1311 family)